jgi:hypothetical protein
MKPDISLKFFENAQNIEAPCHTKKSILGMKFTRNGDEILLKWGICGQPPKNISVGIKSPPILVKKYKNYYPFIPY